MLIYHPLSKSNMENTFLFVLFEPHTCVLFRLIKHYLSTEKMEHIFILHILEQNIRRLFFLFR